MWRPRLTNQTTVIFPPRRIAMPFAFYAKLAKIVFSVIRACRLARSNNNLVELFWRHDYPMRTCFVGRHSRRLSDTMSDVIRMNVRKYICRQPFLSPHD